MTFLKKHKFIFLSIILFSLSFPPFNLGFLSYIALIPLIHELQQQHSYKLRFKQGMLFGSCSMAIFHTWFFELFAFAPMIGVLCLWALFSLYLGLFYGLACITYDNKSNWKYITFPAAWTLSEFIRSCGPIGNPAGFLGYSQAYYPLLIQITSILGVFGLSFIICYYNCLIYKCLMERKKSIFITIILISILFLAANNLLLNSNKMPPQDQIKETNIVTYIIQPNHEQDRKLNVYTHNSLLYENLHLIEKSINENPNLIILPETITSSLNLEKKWFTNKLYHYLNKKNTTLVFGTPSKINHHYYNSAVALSEYQKTLYHKQKLMPFGEYWPFRSLLNLIGLEAYIPGSDYSSTKTIHLLKTYDNQALASMICLESLYPWYARKQVKDGAKTIVVLANNAWFFDSKAAEQHFQMSILRAVENRRYLIQASNTGLSGIISPNGYISSQSKLNEQTLIKDNIHYLTTLSFYTKYGDVIIYICLLIVIINRLFKRNNTIKACLSVKQTI